MKNHSVIYKVNDVTVGASIVYHGVVGDFKHSNMGQSYQEDDWISLKIRLHGQCVVKDLPCGFLPVTKPSQEAGFRRNFLCGIIREFMLKRFYCLAFFL